MNLSAIIDEGVSLGRLRQEMGEEFPNKEDLMQEVGSPLLFALRIQLARTRSPGTTTRLIGSKPKITVEMLCQCQPQVFPLTSTWV
jgi:hypothetical protein